MNESLLNVNLKSIMKIDNISTNFESHRFSNN